MHEADGVHRPQTLHQLGQITRTGLSVSEAVLHGEEGASSGHDDGVAEERQHLGSHLEAAGQLAK